MSAMGPEQVAPRVQRRLRHAHKPAGLLTIVILVGCSPGGTSSTPSLAADSPASSPVEPAPGGTAETATGRRGFEDLEGSRHVPGREWAQTMRDCLVANGWDVVIPDDDPATLEHRGLVEQGESYIDDFVRCSNVHDFSPEPPTFDEDAAGRAWEEYTSAAECMREHGYDPPELPSRERFLAELQRGGGSSWNPHAVPPGEDAVAAATIRACPISNDYILFGIRYPDE